MQTFYLRDDFIKLGQALKACRLAESGVDAKYMVQEGQVRVNGQVETRRGRKLVPGDEFSFQGQTVRVEQRRGQQGSV